MTMGPGTRLGHYEIVGSLGAGGMGVVYRARDTRLGRDVALKALPEPLSGDGERLRRFEHEARAAGAIEHPNVLVVFDVGTHEGAPYLVTELLEGTTLRERLREGPLPLRKALDYAAQLARGMAAAHAKGIVHRDLKPDNVFVTRDGRVKILDFGVAKAFAGNGGEQSDVTATNTADGTVVGTAGYMSPEQVRGRAADARSDVFALGAMLYEMLCGQRAFSGETPVDRGYSVLTADPPPLSDKGALVPAAVERLVRRCLEKAPDERFQSARDLAFSLEALGDPSEPSGRAASLSRAPAYRPAHRMIWLGVLLSLGAAGAGFALGRVRGDVAPTPATAPVAGAPAQPRFERVTFRSTAFGPARFSPDGRGIIFSGHDGPMPRVYSSLLGSPDARQLTTESSKLVSVSSTGEMALAMRPQWKDKDHGFTLARASISGGGPRDLAENVMWADFGPDGKELAIVRDSEAKTRLEYPIGKPIYETDGSIAYPRVSPKGDLIAFISWPIVHDDRGSVDVVALDGQKRRLAGPFYSVQGIAWAPDGSEVWYSATLSPERGEGTQRVLHAVKLDGKDRVVLSTPGTLNIQDIAKDGRVLLWRPEERSRIAALTAESEREQDLSWFDWSVPIDLSRDAKTLLFIEGRDAAMAEVQTFLRRTDGSPAVRLAEGLARALSPDGSSALISPRQPFNTLSLVPTGSGQARDLQKGSIAGIEQARFFRTGDRIVILGREPGKRLRLWLQDLSSGPPRALFEEGVTTTLAPSPKGDELIVYSDAGGWQRRPIDGGAGKPLKNLQKQDLPIQWSEDAKSVFVREGQPPGEVRPANIVRYDLASGRRTPLRELWQNDSIGVQHVLITPDGRYHAYAYQTANADLYLCHGLR